MKIRLNSKSERYVNSDGMTREDMLKYMEELAKTGNPRAKILYEIALKNKDEDANYDKYNS